MPRRILAAVGLLCLLGTVASASSESERRASTGIRIFRALLAAEIGLADKVSPDGDLQVAIVYDDDRAQAESLAAELRGNGGEATTIRGFPVHVFLVTAADLPHRDDAPAGIFLAEEPTSKELDALIAYGIDRHVIVYSPFAGHVERGVTAGLSIEAQVRPYVNLHTLNAAGIRLKAFFLKVTKSYAGG